MTNPWLERRVLDYAHQGGAKEAPSSTLYAMRRAVEAGADALELDVHMTADRVLVVCHDATVDRTTEGTGAICELSSEEVQSLDNAYWWVPGSVVDHDASPEAFVHRGKAADDAAFRIPTLVEVIEAFPRTFLNLDIKQTAPAVPAYEAELAQLLMEHGRIDDVIVASFNDASTEEFARHAPRIATSYGTVGTADFYRAVRDGQTPSASEHVALQVPHSFGDTVLVDERFVGAAHAAGVAVHVWTVDDEGEMAALVDLGVDGVMTDRPTALERVLAERGAPRFR
ncbi:MAG TPA: glycerophosphodiester phosphodiesterase [Acidimicrobiales bacterium]|nr:glycerophosphodiester phosphodiesterase [Acidimicrobiales bacterium]